jgi:hypothetical protein
MTGQIKPPLFSSLSITVTTNHLLKYNQIWLKTLGKESPDPVAFFPTNTSTRFTHMGSQSTFWIIGPPYVADKTTRGVF